MRYSKRLTYIKYFKIFLKNLSELEQNYLIEALHLSSFYDDEELEEQIYFNQEKNDNLIPINIEHYKYNIGLQFFEFLHESIKNKSKKLFIFNLRTLPNKEITTFIQDIEKLKNLEHIEHIKYFNKDQQKNLNLELYALLYICLTAQLD